MGPDERLFPFNIDILALSCLTTYIANTVQLQVNKIGSDTSKL